MEDLIPKLIEAAQERAWYPLIAIVCSMVIAIWRKVQPLAFERIPPQLQWIPAVVLAALASFVESQASGVGWQVAIGLAFWAAFAAGIPAIGLHRVVKEVAKKPEGGSGSTGGKATGLLGSIVLVVALCLPLPGCAEARPILRTVDDVAKNLCALFYAEKQSLSVEDAARSFCRTRDAWEPWIDEALRAQQAGGAVATSRDAGVADAGASDQ